MFRKKYGFIAGVMFFIGLHCLNAQVVINEVMANNKATIKSNTGKFSDWIELYNTSNEPVNLAGWMLTDNPDKPGRHVIFSCAPDSTTIAAHGYLVLWADGNTDAGVTHLAFKLSKKGEFIALYKEQQGNPVCVDSVRYKALNSDTSFGRKPDGGKEWTIFKKPSPGKKNF